MRIKTVRHYVYLAPGDLTERLELDATLAPGDKRHLVVSLPGAEIRCAHFELIEASEEERAELRKRKLIKD